MGKKPFHWTLRRRHSGTKNVPNSVAEGGKVSNDGSFIQETSETKFISFEAKIDRISKWIQQSLKRTKKNKSHTPLQVNRSPVRLYSPFYIVTPSPRCHQNSRRKQTPNSRRCVFPSPLSKC